MSDPALTKVINKTVDRAIIRFMKTKIDIQLSEWCTDRSLNYDDFKHFEYSCTKFLHETIGLPEYPDLEDGPVPDEAIDKMRKILGPHGLTYTKMLLLRWKDRQEKGA